MTLSITTPLFAFGAGLFGCPWCILLPLLLMLGAWLLGWFGGLNWIKARFSGVNEELESTRRKYNKLQTDYSLSIIHI